MVYGPRHSGRGSWRHCGLGRTEYFRETLQRGWNVAGLRFGRAPMRGHTAFQATRRLAPGLWPMPQQARGTRRQRELVFSQSRGVPRAVDSNSNPMCGYQTFEIDGVAAVTGHHGHTDARRRYRSARTGLGGRHCCRAATRLHWAESLLLGDEAAHEKRQPRLAVPQLSR